MSRTLEVLLHGIAIGRLTELATGHVELRLLESYRDLVPRPVLGQRFEDDLGRVHRNRKGLVLPDFFANLVPEGRLREVLADRAGIDRRDDFALLDFVGRDLVGAVTTLRLDEVGSVEAGLGETAESAPRSDGDPMRFSLAGVQLKFSMLRGAEKLTLPAADQRGEWIVKLDSPTFPELPENEYSMLRWASAAGFEVPEHHLHDVDHVVGEPRRYGLDGTRVLAVRRYDRTPEGRVHQEDFAQAVGLPPEKKYDQVTYEALAQLARRFVDDEAAEEVARRLVFVVASGNNDAHLKNWSLVYPDRVRAALAPVYDQVSTVAWPAPGRELALKLAGVKDFGRLNRDTFARFGERSRIGGPRMLELLDETLETLRVAWRQVREDLPLPSRHRSALREHWRRVPVLRAMGPLEA